MARSGLRVSSGGFLRDGRLVLIGLALGLALPHVADWRQVGDAVAGEIGVTDLERVLRRLWPGQWAPMGETASGRFVRCRRGERVDCVVDGDTFRMGGDTIRIADIDTPETHPPRCAAEARKGEAATERMRELLSAGPFVMEPQPRARDKYGRKLAVVSRDGVSLGAQLVEEGLARPYAGGKRRGWC